jgi:hypothetical protein
VVPIGDGDAKDQPPKLCTQVVHLRDPALSYNRKTDEPLPLHALHTAEGRVLTDYLPRCLDMITTADVIRAVERYFEGGVVRYLTLEQRTVATHISC